MDGERFWPARLRWRLRGAWQWPTFLALTVVNAIVLRELPLAGERGPDGLMPALILAGFLNLFVVAVLAPLAGRLVRRRRPDLPNLIARDYAGTALLCVLAAGLVVAGLAHRDELQQRRAERRQVAQLVHDYVVRHEPSYRAVAGSIDVLRYNEDLFRGCVPDPTDGERALCLIVNIEPEPPRVQVDDSREPNSAFRVPGGYR